MTAPDDSYKATWNARSTNLADGMLAVDGSADEDVLVQTGAYAAAQLRAALAPGPGQHLFEIGCGVGRLGAQLAPEVASWTGLDIAENMVALTRQRLAGVAGARAHALAGPKLSPLADASMDKGWCVAVFIHMDKEDMVLYLREVMRVLRPGGLFYFDHWNLAHPVGWRRFAYEVDEIGRSDPAQRKDVARNQFCTPEELRLYVRHAGLELLFEHSDSPWVQMVVRRPDGDAAAALAEQARLAAARAAIACTPLWTRLFAEACEVLIEGVHPATMLARWRSQPETGPELPMFIAWLAAVWQRQPQRWPALPA